MADLKVVCWNCGGLRRHSPTSLHKMAFLSKQYPTVDFSVLALLETHHRTEDDFPPFIQDLACTHTLIHTPANPLETYTGIILLIDHAYEVLTTTVVVPGRVINLQLRHTRFQQEHNLTFYYGRQPSALTKEELRNTFTSMQAHHEIQHNNMIIGDFNFVDHPKDRAGHRLGTRDLKVQSFWEEFKNDLDLDDPFRVKYPAKVQYSYVSQAGKSRIDRVYVSQHHAPHVIHYQYIHTPFHDHKIQQFTLQQQQPRGPAYWKLNVSVLHDRQYRRIIELVIANLEAMHIADKQQWWDLFLTSVRSRSLTYTKRKHFLTQQLKSTIIAQMHALEQVSQDLFTPQQSKDYIRLQHLFTQHERHEIQGHITRTKGLPTYEINEPDIQYFANLEKRTVKLRTIVTLKDTAGAEHTASDELLNIAHGFYTHLYTPTPVHASTQTRLLQHVRTTLNPVQQQMLDAPLTTADFTRAVQQLPPKKSPGIDGIPIEFYQTFWPLIHTHYMAFIDQVQLSSFLPSKNTGVTTILYKDRGDLNDLANYRPLSLLNVDVKIFTKALANRLHQVLPTIVHPTQTCITGRKIDSNVHLLRDMIQLANTQTLEAAFVFLDQEKAFDRVNHAFLYRTLHAFGFGRTFIQWVQLLYSNATTRIKVNGFLTPRIPLRRGVRQGCPLSPLLYVLIIEILGLQLRANPNIVGFTVGGEKIISLHYADDTVITMKQNRCFKEVYKELTDYEHATGAKVNATKTKGLWTGRWKGSSDAPLNYEWTDGDVENLGLFFGNDRPALRTFEKLLPKVLRSLNYWKQFRLNILSRARTVEIFLASKLWYAARFYPIPLPIQQQLQRAFNDYVNWPHRIHTVSQQELFKLREHGGVKLIHIQTKSEASKVAWIIQLLTNPHLTTHLALVTDLLGQHFGHIQGRDLFFLPPALIARTVKASTPFYREALKAFSAFTLDKHIPDVTQESVFYNRAFLDADHEVLRPDKHFTRMRMYTYLHFLTQQDNMEAHRSYVHRATVLLNSITHISVNRREHGMDTIQYGYLPLRKVTEKILYAEILRTTYLDHRSIHQWREYFQAYLDWPLIWQACHNPLSQERTTALIWEQLHLNYYTTFNYNKWHPLQQPAHCPLCHGLPLTPFHLILTCPLTISLWCQLQPLLQRLHPSPVTPQEMAFGLLGSSPTILLRNWLTFHLRACIHAHERFAYHHPQGLTHEVMVRAALNRAVTQELQDRLTLFTARDQLPLFLRRYAPLPVFLHKPQDAWVITPPFP